jgi:muramidase (phage lysozyme)
MGEEESLAVSAAIVAAAYWYWQQQKTARDGASIDESWTDSGTTEQDESGGVMAMVNDVIQPTATSDEANVAAFLAMIRVGEGTANARGYYELCGGSFVTDLSDHPANMGWRGLPLSDAQCRGAGRGPGCVSTAAGAYQFIKPTWNGLRDKLGLPDFSPASQDAAAIEMIRQRGALSAVQSGDIVTAIKKCEKTWASFSGAGYGQHEVALNSMLINYTNAGGVLA